MYIVKNKQSFTNNWEIHSHNTRTTNNLHIPTVNTTKYKRGAYYMSSKIFNQLSNYIKNTANNEKTFKKVLHRFLIDNSIDEYLNFK
jgi:ferritin